MSREWQLVNNAELDFKMLSYLLWSFASDYGTIKTADCLACLLIQMDTIAAGH